MQHALLFLAQERVLEVQCQADEDHRARVARRTTRRSLLRSVRGDGTGRS